MGKIKVRIKGFAGTFQKPAKATSKSVIDPRVNVSQSHHRLTFHDPLLHEGDPRRDTTGQFTDDFQLSIFAAGADVEP